MLSSTVPPPDGMLKVTEEVLIGATERLLNPSGRLLDPSDRPSPAPFHP